MPNTWSSLSFGPGSPLACTKAGFGCCLLLLLLLLSPAAAAAAVSALPFVCSAADIFADDVCIGVGFDNCLFLNEQIREKSHVLFNEKNKNDILCIIYF